MYEFWAIFDRQILATQLILLHPMSMILCCVCQIICTPRTMFLNAFVIEWLNVRLNSVHNSMQSMSALKLTAFADWPFLNWHEYHSRARALPKSLAKELLTANGEVLSLNVNLNIQHGLANDVWAKTFVVFQSHASHRHGFVLQKKQHTLNLHTQMRQTAHVHTHTYRARSATE